MVDQTALTSGLRALERDAGERDWPETSVRLLGEAGCWGGAIAESFGGSGAEPRRQLAIYEAVARGSLTSALILTQHDAACELLGDCDNDELAGRVLPGCAVGRLLATVGISQLTTSRRTGTPAMRAVACNEGFRLTGVMPWVTSAPKADYIVTGAVLPDGNQILACVPTTAEGLIVGEPAQLMALGASWTGEVRCQNLLVTTEHMMRGPMERVLRLRAPVKPLSVSAVGVGMAGALLDEIGDRSASLPQAARCLGKEIPSRYEAVRDRLYGAADALNDAAAEVPAMEIRTAVNDLLVRLSATILTLAKGSGYLSSQPVQRLVREAMFFMVWSAPPHVQAGTIERLWA